jgi:hypothetical protein
VTAITSRPARTRVGAGRVQRGFHLRAQNQLALWKARGMGLCVFYPLTALAMCIRLQLWVERGSRFCGNSAREAQLGAPCVARFYSGSRPGCSWAHR